MNRSLQTIAAAMLFACYALPVLAGVVSKFTDHKVKVYTGKRAKPLSGKSGHQPADNPR